MVDSRAIKRQAPSTYKGSNYKHRTKAHAPVIHTSNADSLKQDYGYIGARNDTTRPSRHTPDKDVDITDITVYVSCYTVTDTAGMLSPPTAWRKQSEFVSSRQSGQIPATVRIGFQCRSNGQSVSNRTC